MDDGLREEQAFGMMQFPLGHPSLRRTFPGAMAFGNYIRTSEDGRSIYTEPSFGAPDGVSFHMHIEDTDYLVRLKSRTAAWWEWEVLAVNGKVIEDGKRTEALQDGNNTGREQ